METKSLEKRIRRTEILSTVGGVGGVLAAVGSIASIAYSVYFDTYSPALSEYNRLESAQTYTERITNNDLKDAVEEHYAARLSTIEQEDEYKREQEESDFYHKLNNSLASLACSLFAIGIFSNLSLKRERRKIENEYFRSRAAK